MQIYVKISTVTLTKDITLQVDPSDTIDNVKAKIQEKEPTVPQDGECLCPRPYKRLEDDKTLSAYKIKHRHTIWYEDGEQDA